MFASHDAEQRLYAAMRGFQRAAEAEAGKRTEEREARLLGPLVAVHEARVAAEASWLAERARR